LFDYPLDCHEIIFHANRNRLRDTRGWRIISNTDKEETRFVLFALMIDNRFDAARKCVLYLRKTRRDIPERAYRLPYIKTAWPIFLSSFSTGYSRSQYDHHRQNVKDRNPCACCATRRSCSRIADFAIFRFPISR